MTILKSEKKFDWFYNPKSKWKSLENVDEMDGADIEKIFEKICRLSSSPLNLPEKEKWFPTETTTKSMKRFESMKTNLNNVKGLLNNYNLEKWHKHTKIQNPAGFVIGEVRKKASPELVTQAWCKFAEILNRFPTLVSQNGSSFYSLHLCEAPGAFITALNHFIKLHRKYVDWAWMGSTLNPFYEGNSTISMINDDRFILNTLENWDFGVDDTGDILEPSNLQHFKTLYRGTMDLVTADGSIDCQADPARQETLVTELHFGEIVTALGALKVGGNFVLKMFTFFEKETHGHLYLLQGLFNTIDVFKPSTSKEGNSEVYVICLGFIGIAEEKLNLLVGKADQKSSKLIFDLADIQDKFIDAMEESAKFFMDLQVGVIHRNIASFKEGYDKKAKTIEKKQVADQFIKRCDLAMIKKKDMIVKDQTQLIAHVIDCRQLDERVEEGTFNDRINARVKTKDDTVTRLKNQLQKLHPSWMPRSQKKVEWVSVPASIGDLSVLEVIKGRPFNHIHTSKFCPSRALNVYRESVSYFVTSSPDSSWHKKIKLDVTEYQQLKNLSEHPLLSTLVKMYPEILDSGVTLVIDSPYLPDGVLKNCPRQLDALIGQLRSAMENLKRGHHLIVLNWPLLTRIQVALMLIIADHFEEIGFVRPIKNHHALFFSEFKGEFHHENVLKDFRQSAISPDTMSIMPVKNITREPMYSIMVAHNINIMREISQFYLLSQN